MIRIRNIKIRVDENQEEILMKKILKKLKVSSILEYKIVKRSIDARDKREVIFVYDVDVSVENENQFYKCFNETMMTSPIEKYEFPIVDINEIGLRPIIVGCGPAGLFCAYFLAKSGLKPIILERGEEISERIKTVEKFWETGILNENSNVQFGEGGAGTFSDGKLNTLVKDKKFLGKEVLNLLVIFGAPKEILYDSKPHIGTDKLRVVVKNMREKIKELGGEFRYNSTLTNIILKDNQLEKIEVNHKYYLECNTLVLAIGHSARDTFEMLLSHDLKMSPKPFAIGVRIEHNNEMISKTQYGEFAKFLKPASYKLTHCTKDKRGVYTFCMCPGGYVVNASSESNRLCINGMSNYDRESPNSNSAIIVTITPKDFGTNPLDGMNYQRKLEEKVYRYGNGLIPTQRYEDFLNNQKTKEFGEVKPIHKGKTIKANLNDILPNFMIEDIKEAIEVFGKKIKGFNDKDALLSVIESRTSSPIKIERNEYCESSIKGIYPCGEGSGYSGGITTSAIDGIKVAEEIVKKCN